MKLLFIPDLIKIDEGFYLEGNSITEIIDKLEEECPINCDLAVIQIINESERDFLGILRLEENCKPKWLL